MHKNVKLLFDKHAASRFTPDSTVLEIGPNAIPSDFQKLIETPCKSWETIDLDRGFTIPLTYVTHDEYKFPIPDNSFDIVFSSSVIEHVQKIWRWMPELGSSHKARGTDRHDQPDQLGIPRRSSRLLENLPGRHQVVV